MTTKNLARRSSTSTSIHLYDMDSIGATFDAFDEVVVLRVSSNGASVTLFFERDEDESVDEAIERVKMLFLLAPRMDIDPDEED